MPVSSSAWASGVRRKVDRLRTTQCPCRTRRPSSRARPSRDALPDPVHTTKTMTIGTLLPKRQIAVLAGERERRVRTREALQRLEAAHALGRHESWSGGGRGHGRGRGRERVEFGRRLWGHRGRVEYTWGERAGAAEDGVLECGELGLLVADVVLERGHLVADGHCSTFNDVNGTAGALTSAFILI